MKKLGIMIIALLFAGMGIVNAQQPQQRNTQMKTYFQNNVLPFVEQQQKNLVQALTTSEKATLAEIRQEMVTFRKQGVQMRKAMQGNFNQQAWENRKAQFDAIVAKARKLVDAHPSAAEKYKKAIETEVAKWKKQMPVMNRGNMGQQGRGHGMMGKTPQSKLQRLSNPALGLLMDTKAMNNMAMQRSNKMYGQNHKMMHRPNGMNRNRQMNNRGNRHQLMMRVMRNPEIRAKVKAYAEKNIFPVISKDREAFGKVLSKKENKIIANARMQMQAQKARMLQMRNNGQMTMNDSTRLVMRQKMDKSRVALRQIVLNHYAEIQKQMASLKEKMPQWRTGIRNIIMPNRPQQQFSPNRNRPTPAKTFMKDRGDIMFLLFDPQHPDSFMFMHQMQGNRRK